MKNKDAQQIQYRNHEIVLNADTIASGILEKKSSNKHRDHFFPILIDNMNLKIGVEIGTDKGLFAKHLLASKLEKLYCIDPWIDDFGSNHKPGFYDKDGSKRQCEAATNLSGEISAQRCELCRGFSAEMVNSAPESIDFLYIDGDHSLEGIYTDLYTWVPKVREGGIVAGHDYKDGPGSGMKDYWGKQLPYKIKTVVDNFCVQYGFKLNVVGGRILSFWFVKN